MAAVTHEQILDAIAEMKITEIADLIKAMEVVETACGAPILAMPTGGTPSIIADGVNGALEPTSAGFARRRCQAVETPVKPPPMITTSVTRRPASGGAGAGGALSATHTERLGSGWSVCTGNPYSPSGRPS